MKACPCGSTKIAPSNIRSRHYRCARCIYIRSRVSFRRYQSSEKGKASKRKYNQAPKALAAKAKYDRSEKGRARSNRGNAKRSWIGDRAIYAKTLEQRDEIRALIRQRLAEFKQRQHESESR
jgi:hypothetical protein